MPIKPEDVAAQLDVLDTTAFPCLETDERKQQRAIEMLFAAVSDLIPGDPYGTHRNAYLRMSEDPHRVNALIALHLFNELLETKKCN